MSKKILNSHLDQLTRASRLPSDLLTKKEKECLHETQKLLPVLQGTSKENLNWDKIDQASAIKMIASSGRYDMISQYPLNWAMPAPQDERTKRHTFDLLNCIHPDNDKNLLAKFFLSPSAFFEEFCRTDETDRLEMSDINILKQKAFSSQGLFWEELIKSEKITAQSLLESDHSFFSKRSLGCAAVSYLSPFTDIVLKNTKENEAIGSQSEMLTAVCSAMVSQRAISLRDHSRHLSFELSLEAISSLLTRVLGVVGKSPIDLAEKHPASLDNSSKPECFKPTYQSTGVFMINAALSSCSSLFSRFHSEHKAIRPHVPVPENIKLPKEMLTMLDLFIKNLEILEAPSRQEILRDIFSEVLFSPKNSTMSERSVRAVLEVISKKLTNEDVKKDFVNHLLQAIEKAQAKNENPRALRLLLTLPNHPLNVGDLDTAQKAFAMLDGVLGLNTPPHATVYDSLEKRISGLLVPDLAAHVSDLIKTLKDIAEEKLSNPSTQGQNKSKLSWSVAKTTFGQDRRLPLNRKM